MGSSNHQLLIAGHFRSGTTWIGKVINRTIHIAHEPDNRGPEHKAIADGYMSSGIDEGALRTGLKKCPGNSRGLKTVQGGVRWAEYRRVAEAMFGETRVLYIVRHLRGIIASRQMRGNQHNSHRDYPNLLREVESGWPNDEDNDFFRALCRHDKNRWDYMTGAMWMAHAYDALRHQRAQDRLVSYELLCTSDTAWDMLWDWLGETPSNQSLKLARLDNGRPRPGEQEAYGGISGIGPSLAHQREYGHHADEAFAHIQESLPLATGTLADSIVEFAEHNRI